jgi:hypothetical protein
LTHFFTIISVKVSEIPKLIVDVLGLGVTTFKGEKGYGKSG